MLKPVSILALDDACAPLAEAVARRVALTDLVQARRVSPDDFESAIESIHERRQSPDSPLRLRDHISSRELILLVVAAAGPSRVAAIDTAQRVRELYRTRHMAEMYSVEILCLLPDLFVSTTPDHYGAAYSLLKQASAADPKPFDAFWLLGSTNAKRVRFGRIEQSLEPYVEAVAGMLTYEPELSGALAGAFRPRGMDATFSSFGYAELVFPRQVALQRLEARLASELIHRVILSRADGEGPSPLLRAKQFVVAEAFTNPLSRIGIEAGQSLFNRFQAKTFITDRTRSADEAIAAVRAELQTHRDTTHMQNLHALEVQRDATATELTALLSRTADETLDRDGFGSSIDFLEALLDPVPDLHAGAGVGPRNLITEINTATAALDARLRLAPNTAASDAARKRIRELDELLQDQKLAADTLAPVSAAEQIAELEGQKASLARQLPELLFAEEAENSAARNAAREAEAARLAEETQAREQQLRELFAQKPRAEEALREALEERRTWIWRQILWGVLGVAAVYAVAFALRVLPSTRWVVTGVGLFAMYSAVSYFIRIAPRIRALREHLTRLLAHIETADRSKNTAHNDELQFEYDIMHRKATLRALQRVRDATKTTLDASRTRLQELEELAASFTLPSIATGALAVSIIDDTDVDHWYEQTADDRKPLFREFPIARSEARRLPLEELQQRIVAYAATGFQNFRKLTLGHAVAQVATESTIAQRLKRLAESSAPMIEVRDEDPEAERAIQRDTTLWIDDSDAAFLAQIRRRLPDGHVKPASDPLRANVLTRVLHYPGYVLGQIEYYRARYDEAKYPESAKADDLLVLSGPVRTAYEQLLLGRAVDLIRLRDDGHLIRATGDVVLGDSHPAAARHLASSSALRQELENEIASRAEQAEHGLRQLLRGSTPMERELIAGLIQRYAAL